MNAEKHPLERSEGEDELLYDFKTKPPSVEDNKVVPLANKDTDKEDPEKEKSIHRIMCYLSAQGKTPNEISEKCDFTVQHVRTILNYERSRLLVAQFMQDDQEDVMSLIKGGQVDAIMEVRQLSKGAKSETVRLNSCKDILDRAQGKAVPLDPNADASKSKKDPEEEIADLDETIRKLS